jgi:Uma2 family endonuclease
MDDVSSSSHSALSLPGISLPGTAGSPNKTADSKSSRWITLFPQNGCGEFIIPSIAKTLSGFRQWALSKDFPDRGRFTFVGEELIIEMSPEYLELHNFLKTEITNVVYRYVQERDLGRVFGDRALFSNDAAGLSTEPDASFAAYSSLTSGRCRIIRGARSGVSDELVGSLDWVLEIVSSSSRRKDTKVLFDAYYHAGVTEYWLVDALGDELKFNILVPGDSGYTKVKPRKGWFASPTFGCSFRLTREKAKDGLWSYKLHLEEKI